MAQKRRKKTKIEPAPKRMPFALRCYAIFTLAGSIFSFALLALFEGRRRGIFRAPFLTHDLVTLYSKLSALELAYWVGMSLLHLIMAIGLLARRRWALWLLILVTLATMGATVFGSWSHHLPVNYLGLAVDFLILIYVRIPRVRASLG